jgi:formylglycine-generating enzyme required for sulfatase activity
MQLRPYSKKVATLCVLILLGTTALAAFENELPVKRQPVPKPVVKPSPIPAPATTYRAGQVFKDCADCPDMVVIPAGSFMMGSPDNEKGRNKAEGPQRTVTLKSFAMGKTEVTVAQFRRFVDAKIYQTDAERNLNAKGCFSWEASDNKFDWREGRSWRNPGWTIKDTEPVACISHNDAMAYIDWIKQSTGKSYELPSESQWEYAARAGSQTSRPWGDNPDDACKHANVADKTKGPISGSTWDKYHDCTDGYWFVVPVATYQANAYGLHDMLGNLWEWTQDVWHDNYTGAPTDGSAWLVGGNQQQRVLRGGSWYTSPQKLRSAFRDGDAPGDRYDGIGFRLARTVP